jgi:DNA-binding NarL/FixJ family response regulator
MFALAPTDLDAVKKILKKPESTTQYRRTLVLKMKHDGATNAEVANFLELTPRTISNAMECYRDRGLSAAITDDP